MAYVKIPKDLTKVKTKVALNLTKRQLIGFSISGIIGFPIYFLFKKILPNDMAMIVMSIAVLPILFATLYEKDNLPFEKHLAYILCFHTSEKIRLYKAESLYHIERKEIESSKNRERRKGRGGKKLEYKQQEKARTKNSKNGNRV
ncbi:PrgI family protein [Fusobacterium necrophorum subsp. funduliforme]|uniref:PrgI family protein n=1 Tax=Fusobacterium TaxID=848 RepID=UPI002F3F3E77